VTICFDVGGMRPFKEFIGNDEADRGPTKPAWIAKRASLGWNSQG